MIVRLPRIYYVAIIPRHGFYHCSKLLFLVVCLRRSIITASIFPCSQCLHWYGNVRHVAAMFQFVESRPVRETQVRRFILLLVIPVDVIGRRSLNADIPQQTVCCYSSRWFWVELPAGWLDGAGAAAAAWTLPRWPARQVGSQVLWLKSRWLGLVAL